MTPWTAYSLYAVFVLGGLGIYFMLPKAGRSQVIPGAVLAILALASLLIVLGLNVATTESSNGFFYLFAAIALAATARVIAHPKPVYSAVYFVLAVVAVAAMLLLQQAEFLAIAVVMIYAGAIVVTYVFVIMLAQQGGAPATDRRAREPFLAVCAGFVTMAAVAVQATHLAVPDPSTTRPDVSLVSAQEQTGERTQPGGGRRVAKGNSFAIGSLVMTRYIVALEIAGVLLLVAMVGAVALSRKRVPIEGVFEPPREPGAAGREVPPY